MASHLYEALVGKNNKLKKSFYEIRGGTMSYPTTLLNMNLLNYSRNMLSPLSYYQQKGEQVEREEHTKNGALQYQSCFSVASLSVLWPKYGGL